MKAYKVYMAVSLSAMLLAGCNHREYCDFSEYDVNTAIHYDWSEVKAKTIPAQLNNHLTGDETNDFVSPPDWKLLKQDAGSYSVFAWNDADNVKMNGEEIEVEKDANGGLMSVGELFTGKENYTVKDGSDIDLETGNNHQWNDPPFHHGTSLRYDTVNVKMKAQTRVLSVYIYVDTNQGDVDISKIIGSMAGISSSRNSDDMSQGVTDGFAILDFVKVNDSTYVGKIRVIGADMGTKQKVQLTVTFDDGGNVVTDADVSDEMDDFNDNMGGDDKNIGVKVQVQKTQVGYNAVITDWKTIDGGSVDVPF